MRKKPKSKEEKRREEEEKATHKQQPPNSAYTHWRSEDSGLESTVSIKSTRIDPSATTATNIFFYY